MLRTRRHFKSCIDCVERLELNSNGINCHTYCKLYNDSKKELEAARKRRDVDTAVTGLQDEGYRRATRGQFQNY